MDDVKIQEVHNEFISNLQEIEMKSDKWDIVSKIIVNIVQPVHNLDPERIGISKSAIFDFFNILMFNNTKISGSF